MPLDPDFERAVKNGTVGKNDFQKFLIAAESGDRGALSTLINNHGGHCPSSTYYAAVRTGRQDTFNWLCTRPKSVIKTSDWDYLRHFV